MRILLLLALCSCAAALQVEVTPPPAELSREASVIVFGVYHAGHMDPEAWQWIEPRLAMSFNRTHCQTYYNEGLLQKNADAFSAIAEDARNEGLGAAVLKAHGASLAASDLYAVVDVSGHIPRKRSSPMVSRPPPQGGGMNFGMGGGGRGGGRRGGGGGPSPSAPSPNPDADAALDLNVSLYLRPDMTRAARVHVRYTGDDEAEAWSSLNTKLRELFPEWHCVAP